MRFMRASAITRFYFRKIFFQNKNNTQNRHAQYFSQSENAISISIVFYVGIFLSKITLIPKNSGAVIRN